jgi:hypothetical protein
MSWFSKRDEEITLRAHTRLIIPRSMDMMQDSAKKDVWRNWSGETAAGAKPWHHGPYPEVCFSQENVHSRLPLTIHGDPLCFVKINFSLLDPAFATLASCHRPWLGKDFEAESASQSQIWHYRQCSTWVA